MSDTKNDGERGPPRAAASETETRHEPETVEIEDRRQKSEIGDRGPRESATTVVEQAAARFTSAKAMSSPSVAGYCRSLSPYLRYRCRYARTAIVETLIWGPGGPRRDRAAPMSWTMAPRSRPDRRGCRSRTTSSSTRAICLLEVDPTNSQLRSVKRGGRCQQAQASIQNIEAQMAVQQGTDQRQPAQLDQAQGSRACIAQQQASRFQTLSKDGWGHCPECPAVHLPAASARSHGADCTTKPHVAQRQSSPSRRSERAPRRVSRKPRPSSANAGQSRAHAHYFPRRWLRDESAGAAW